ncbi:unnamed protein product [Clavelina lepadiformis]|uniref:Dipeptidase n=1 Tax=Clavelina lepadiformis TaxID=159417 RepID=A0ABP0FZK0_CLALP
MPNDDKYRIDSGRVSKSNKTLFIFVGALILAAAIAVAIAVPIALNSNVKTNLETANEILDKYPIIDGHNDWAWQFRDNLQNVINNISLWDDLTEVYPDSHTDIPRLKKGKVGAQFWACFVHCNSAHKDAVRQGLEQMDMIRRFIEAYSDTFQFATTAKDIEDANAAGKIASLIGVEGGHMIDSSLAALRMYYALGARYMTLTHSCDTPWADASNRNYSNGGLTDFGKRVVAEMNRIGILVDISHVSDQTMKDVFSVTTAPVIYSHSSARHLCDHVRNVPDDILQLLKENNGIIMINFYNDYVTCSTTANTTDVADHFDYIKSLIGVEYLGFGADYDGVTRVPTGLEDVSTYPNLVAELLKRGWTEDELRMITRDNLLRVLRKAESVARPSNDPDETWISASSVNYPCRT